MDECPLLSPLRRRNQPVPVVETDDLADSDEVVFSHAAE